MKEHRFKELLNLFLDHELSEQEADELEAEVRRDPARRATYHAYCRMHKGCTLLFQGERGRAPERPVLARALAEVERKASQPAAESWLGWGQYAGGAAMAAALVFAVVRFGWQGGEVEPDFLLSEAEPTVMETHAREMFLAEARQSIAPQVKLSIAPTLVLATSGAESTYRTAAAPRWIDEEHSNWARPQPYTSRSTDSRASWEQEFARRSMRAGHREAPSAFRAELTTFAVQR